MMVMVMRMRRKARASSALSPPYPTHIPTFLNPQDHDDDEEGDEEEAARAAASAAREAQYLADIEAEARKLQGRQRDARGGGRAQAVSGGAAR